MDYQVVQIQEKRIIGLSARTTNEQEMFGQGVIGATWARFWQDAIPAQVLGEQKPVPAYGVYTVYETDHTGSYMFVAGVEVLTGHTVPANMTAITLIPGTYLKFSGTGELPEVVIQTWQNIWNFFRQQFEWKRTYTTDFEIYGSGRSDIEIYIAVSQFDD